MPEPKYKFPEPWKDDKPPEGEPISFGQIFSEVYDKVQSLGGLLNPVNAISTKMVEDQQVGEKNFIINEILPVLTAPGQAFDEGLALLGIEVPWNPSAKYKEVETAGALGKTKVEKEYNPLAAAPKFIESMLHLGAAPFTALDQTLRHHGLETEANIIAFPGEKFAEGYVAGKSLVQKGLDQIPGYSLEKEREALRLVLMTKGTSPEIAFDDEKLDEAINNFDIVGQIAASVIPYAGLGKVAGLGKQIGQKLKKPLPVKTDPYVESLKPKELDIPKGEGSFGGRESGGVIKNLTREEQIQLGEIKLGRDEALNERIYLQDKVKLNAQEIRDLKGVKGKEAVAKRKAIIKENAESFKRIKELDEIAEYRSKEIEAFETKPTIGLLKEHNLPPLKDMSGTNAPSNINFAVATEPGAKTTTKMPVENVLGIKRKIEIVKEKPETEVKPVESKTEKLVEPVKDYKTFEDLVKEEDSKQITKFVQKELGEEGFNKFNEQVTKELKDIPVEEQGRYVENRWLEEAQKIAENKPEINQEKVKDITDRLDEGIDAVARQNIPKKEAFQKFDDYLSDRGEFDKELNIRALKDNPEYVKAVQNRVVEKLGVNSWDEVPQILKIYRGEFDAASKPIKTESGSAYQNYSLNKDIAQRFAREGGKVYEYEINKNDIIWATDSYLTMNDMEIVANPSKIKPVIPKKPGLGTSTQLNMMPDVSLITDAAKYGGELFNKGYKSFSKWADEMKKTYGNEISPQLIKIWDMSKVAVKETKGDEKTTSKQVGIGQGLNEIAKTDRQTLYEQNRKVSKENDTVLNKTKEKLAKEKEGIKRTAKIVFEPITTSIEKISPEIFRKFRKFSFDYQVKLLGRHKIVGDYFDKQLKAKMSDEVAKDLDLALKNGWMDDAHKIAKEYGFDNELNKVIKAKDDLARELGVKTIENHFPRMVDDFEGFVNYLEEKYPDYYKDNFSRMIAEKSQRKGKPLTKEEEATLINNAIRGYNPGISLSDVSNMRKRMLDILDGEMNQFYANSNVSLMRYMNQMTELAEARKFFGNKGFDVNESIGAYIKDIRDGKKLGIKGSRELMDVFKARFNQRTITSDPIALLRDIGVITKLGNPFSALTQIKDVTYSVYFSPLGAPKNYVKVIGNKLGLNEIAWKIEEMGIDPLKIAQELSDPRMRSKYVNRSLKASGFSALDMIGKETLINTLWDKYQRQARKTGNVNVEFQRRIERYFGKGEEKAKVLDDLRRGKKTDRTAFLLYNELVGTQPISLAEMSRGYLTGGNWRVGYFLKTFSIRQLDFALNETARVMRNPDLTKAQRIEGGKNLFKLTTSLVAMGVSVDTLKEWVKSIISGEKFNIEETLGAKAIDNILSVVLLSRYDYTTAKREGVEEAVGKKVLPPADFISDPIIYGLNKLMGEKGEALKMTKNVPIIGQFIYEYFKKPKTGRGSFNLNFNVPSLPSL